jgi:hypothetical protein
MRLNCKFFLSLQIHIQIGTFINKTFQYPWVDVCYSSVKMLNHESYDENISKVRKVIITSNI